jgi:RNA ligase
MEKKLTLHYKFPIINHLDDVLPAIENNKNFIHVKKDGYSVIDYTHNAPDTFPYVDNDNAAILRECRGLTFGPNGELISRRYHKFFNYGERIDLVANMDIPHTILEKLDGSMITPVKINGDIRWCTKMGITNVSENVEKYLSENKLISAKYFILADQMLATGITPIFEWCSNKNRIVVNQPIDRLVLTALRYNVAGTYELYETLKWLAERYEIDYVKEIKLNLTGTRDQIYEEINKNCLDIEGIVIRFDDGHMLKVKADWYILQHRARSDIENIKYAIQIVINNQVDDYISLISDPIFVNKLIELQKNINNDIEDFSYFVKDVLVFMRNKNISRKDFALDNYPGKYVVTEKIKSCIFKIWDTNNPYEDAKKYAIEQISKSYDKACQILSKETLEKYNEAST